MLDGRCGGAGRGFRHKTITRSWYLRHGDAARRWDHLVGRTFFSAVPLLFYLDDAIHSPWKPFWLVRARKGNISLGEREWDSRSGLASDGETYGGGLVDWATRAAQPRSALAANHHRLASTARPHSSPFSLRLLSIPLDVRPDSRAGRGARPARRHHRPGDRCRSGARCPRPS